MQYFVHTGDGYEIYDTCEKAKQAAQDAIDAWRDCCDPGWPEEVANVFWGPIFGQSKPEDRGENNEYVEWVLESTHQEYRCEPCGGIVRFDGTKPGISHR